MWGVRLGESRRATQICSPGTQGSNPTCHGSVARQSALPLALREILLSQSLLLDHPVLASSPVTSMPAPLLALLAAAGWLTVGTQFVLSIRASLSNGGSAWSGIVSYFGYFTLLTNILCAAVLTAHWLGGDSGGRAFLRSPGVTTTAATSIIVVGVVYHLLLASTWSPTGIDLVVDTMLHTVMPILFVMAWTRLVPRGAIALQQTPRWSSYILGYAIYILIRGAILGEYPYPFIDVTALGYGTALRNAALLGVAFVALSAGMVGLNRVLGAPRTETLES